MLTIRLTFLRKICTDVFALSFAGQARSGHLQLTLWTAEPVEHRQDSVSANSGAKAGLDCPSQCIPARMPRPFCTFSSSVCCLRPQAAVCRARSFQHTKRSLSQRVRRQPGRIPHPATRAVWQSADSQLEAIRLKQSDVDDRKWLQRLWATIDVTATLGSVCGAVAFIILEEAWLMGLPVILPLIALFANRQREKVSLQASHCLPYISCNWHACNH